MTADNALTDTQTYFDVATAALDYAQREPQEILRLALASFERIAISISGADAVLVDMATRITPDVTVFSLDTGRLHPETHQLLEQVRKRYAIPLEILSPDAFAVADLVSNKGLFSFYEDGHQECCGIRKAEPLRRKLRGLDAWISGQRKDQSPGTRSAIAIIENDETFGTPNAPLVKFNPLANWTSEQLWAYIHEHDVPFNTLHSRGFMSIGCAPCTRPVLPHQQERLGRWWWEDASGKECGLHARNIAVVGLPSEQSVGLRGS